MVGDCEGHCGVSILLEMFGGSFDLRNRNYFRIFREGAARPTVVARLTQRGKLPPRHCCGRTLDLK